MNAKHGWRRSASMVICPIGKPYTPYRLATDVPAKLAAASKKTVAIKSANNAVFFIMSSMVG
jgi:hypothetical protein